MLEERFCFGEGGVVAHRAEQLGRLVERLLGGGVFEGEQAAALAEEGVGALGDVPELLPAIGRLGVEGCRGGVVAGVLGELGARGAKGVLAYRKERLEALSEPLGELAVAGGERGPHHRGQPPGVVGRLVRARRLLELGEQGGRPLGRLPRERGSRRRECKHNHVGRATCACRLDEPVRLGTCRLLAAGEADRELDPARLGQVVNVAARLECGGERAGPFERLLGAA